jgi:hypothetical protein
MPAVSKHTRTLVAGGILALGLAVAPWWAGAVFAEDGTSGSGRGSTSGTSGSGSGDSHHTTTPPPTTTPTPTPSPSGSGDDSSGDDHALSKKQLEALKTAKQKAEQAKEDAKLKLEDAKANADKVRQNLKEKHDKLQGDKLTLCKGREHNITNVMGDMSARGQRQLVLFTTISDRVKAFYVSKGYSVDNYDALVASIDAAKTDAQTAIDKVAADKAAFKCDGTDPSGTADLFKADVKAMNEALKAYRTAVKNLISAVKIAAGDTNPDPTPAPTPTPTPTPTPAPTTGGNQ